MLKLPAVLLWIGGGGLLCGLATLFCRRFGLAPPANLYRKFHGGLAALFQLDIRIVGQICPEPNTLFVVNHASYLDIFVLGSKINGSFIAKSEVASWPVFGKLAGIQSTLFLTRKSTRAASQVEQLASRLAQGSMILFPEGTSTPGGLVEPFRSSLFAAAAENESVVPKIQPVTIAYTHYANEPMTQTQRDRYAWYLPMKFAPHFLAALGLSSARTSVEFHPPVALNDFPSRKACAAACETRVRSGLLKALGETAETCPVGYQTLSRRWQQLQREASESSDTSTHQTATIH